MRSSHSLPTLKNPRSRNITSSNGVPSQLTITVSTLLVVCLLFLFSIYHFHITISSHGDGKGIFTNNRLSGFNPLNNSSIVENVSEHVSWVNFEELARKDIEYYLNKIKVINYNDHSVIQTTMSRPSPEVNKNSLRTHSLNCPHAELVQFWSATTDADIQYSSPFKDYGPVPKYVTFEPDVGGWNNIRMQMELVVVFAYATGRTLVLPPDQPMYLLNAGQGHEKAHSFADFFPFDLVNERFPVISMETFMQREAVSGHMTRHNAGIEVLFPPGNQTLFRGTEREERLRMWEYLRNVSSCPQWKNLKDFLVIPPRPGLNTSLLPPKQATEYQRRMNIAAAGRTTQYYDDGLQQQRFIHFISKPALDLRLLEHFYTFLHFQDPKMDLYYKRFVRDYLHYTDVILCKSAAIVDRLLREGGGSYISFHIRRGDFQYKEMKLSADQILDNIGLFIPQGTKLAYVATDEKNMSFFKPFFARFPAVRFLKDFMDIADLRAINPNYLGMIDQVVCSRGEMFTGTWFSTFSGYITRMRGYLGYSDTSIRYGDKGHRDRFQHHELPKFPFYMREWNISWYNID